VKKPGLFDFCGEGMEDIQFLTWDELERIHRRQLELFGGQDGYTDRGVVESAFTRPQWTAKYGDPDIAELAAEYWYGLATTQGFSDGNKRTATYCALRFLHKNGYDVRCTDAELYEVAIGVATNVMDRDALAEWIAKNLTEFKAD
jgi:death-on-curing protein